jgi:ATP-binding cassette subfamily B protein
MHNSPHMLLASDPEKVKGASLSTNLLRRVLGFARPYRWMLAGFLLIIVLEALVALVPVLLFKEIIDVIPSGDRGRVTALALLIVAAAVATAALSFFDRWWSSRIGEGVIFDLRVQLFDHVQRLPLAFFTRTQTGALISRMNNDVIGAQRAVTGTLGTVVSNVVVLTTTLIAMFVLQWQITLVALVLLPIFIVPAKRIGRKMQAITRDSFTLNADMNTQMTERLNVSGAQLVKLFGRYEREADAFADRAGQVRDIGVRGAMYGRTFFIALGLVGAVGTAAVYGIGGNLVITGAIELGTLVAMAAFVAQIYAPLTSLTNARVDIMTAFVSFERVFEILDLANAIVDRPGAIDLVDPAGRIEIDDVWFAYPAASVVSLASLEADGGRPLSDRAGEPVLKGISATIEAGQLVALVGPSGAGKTTVSSLIPRLYDVTGGAIRVDGTDVRDLTQQSLHDAIGVVSQDPHLFHESIGANLRYAKPDATDDEIVAACRAAQIHDVIAALPDGYDTLVGERGHRLSGGEKQRLAIARMLLKDPAVVILDEATSHLDSENEHLVQEALTTALRGRTSLVIAHRLSTITEADQIIVLDEGRIVARGTHTGLLAEGGLYADLYRTLIRGDGGSTPSTRVTSTETASPETVLVDATSTGPGLVEPASPGPGHLVPAAHEQVVPVAGPDPHGDATGGSPALAEGKPVS